MVRRPGLLVVSVLVALVVGGCDGGDPEPEFSDEVSLGPSASAPSSEASPSESFDPTEESAREFIRRWFSAGVKAQQTGHVKRYRSLAARGCQPCHAAADRIREIYRDGGYIEPGRVEVRRIVHDNGNQWTVDVWFAPTELREAADASIQQLKGGKVRNVVYLTEVADVWRMEHLVERPA